MSEWPKLTKLQIKHLHHLLNYHVWYRNLVPHGVAGSKKSETIRIFDSLVKKELVEFVDGERYRLTKAGQHRARYEWMVSVGFSWGEMNSLQRIYYSMRDLRHFVEGEMKKGEKNGLKKTKERLDMLEAVSAAMGQIEDYIT